VLGVYGFYTAKTKEESIFQNVVWYILLALVVIVASHYLGLLINQRFS
jgi:VIT1/CCC1 family predicted Fe2+/Mn2+ transporter